MKLIQNHTKLKHTVYALKAFDGFSLNVHIVSYIYMDIQLKQ